MHFSCSCSGITWILKEPFSLKKIQPKWDKYRCYSLCSLFSLSFFFFFLSYSTVHILLQFKYHGFSPLQTSQSLCAGKTACTILLLLTLWFSDPGVRKHLKGRIHFCQPQHHLCVSRGYHILRRVCTSGSSASGSTWTTHMVSSHLVLFKVPSEGIQTVYLACF